MSAVLTGTPVAVVWASGADPAGQSITIPADATAVYMFWTYDGLDANGHGLSSVTLNSAAPDETFEITTLTSYYVATGVAAWYNPSTGSQTLDVAWDAAPAEGPTTIVAFVKDGNTTGWRDAQADHKIGTTACTTTVTTVSGDLVIKLDQRYDTLNNPPSLSSGWTNGQTTDNNSEHSRLSYISASSTTQVCNSENEDYSSVVAISIPANTGTSIATGLGSLTLTGFAPAVSVSGDVSIAAGLGQVVLTGFAPSLSSSEGASANISVGLGALTVTGLAPSISATANVSISSALGELVIAGYAPDQTLTLASPPAAALVLTGFAPTIQVSAPGEITTGLGSLVLTGFAPTVSATDSASITPDAGALTLTGFAPSVAATDNQFVTAGLGQTVLTGFAPSISATDNQFATPDAGALTILGYAPSITQDGSFTVVTDVGTLQITGYAPSVSGVPSAKHGGGFRRQTRNYIYKGKRYYNLTNDELARLIAADLVDITREDIKVTYKNKKPHPIAKDAWKSLQETIKSLDGTLQGMIPIQYDDDEDIEAIIALL